MSIEKPYVLGFVGSPRRGGNTEILVDEVLRGAEEAGAEVEKIFLPDLKIGPCRACEYCFANGRCVQRDDMDSLLEKMSRSQVWVLGTPVYFRGPSTQFKIFLDRWFGQNAIVDFPKHKTILAMPLGFEAKNADYLIGMFNSAFAHMNMEPAEVVLAPNAWEAGKVRQYPEILAEAYRLGANTAKAIVKKAVS